MGTKTIWLAGNIDEEKLKKVAKTQKKSISKLFNNLLKENYDVLKEKK